MLKRSIFLVVACVFASAAAVRASDVPNLINFQGKLLDNNNVPKNGSFSMQFNIYKGDGTTKLWAGETQTVTVTNGVFAVQLGAVTALTPAVFQSSAAFLGVTVGTDAEMRPLQQLIMAPYAYTAAQLVQNGNILVNAGTANSTFTSAGNLLVPYGIVATTADFNGQVTIGPGATISTFTTGGNLQVAFGITAASTVFVGGAVSTSSGTLVVRSTSTGNADPVLNVQNQTGGSVFQVRQDSHIHSEGLSPTISNCGVSSSVTGNDVAGKVKVGTSVTTTCTVVFSAPYSLAPSCVISSTMTANYGTLTSVSSMTITASAAANLRGTTISYFCLGGL